MSPGRPNTRPYTDSYPRGERLTRNASLGMALFVFTEAMLFAGFISAFVIVQSNAPAGAWPPPGQPRLPVSQTAVNTLALLASGVALFFAGRAYAGPRRADTGKWMALAMGLGAFFVASQGMEWARLLGQGLTMTSSQMGAFFYLIIGTHAVHAAAAIIALALAWNAQRRGRLGEGRFAAVRLFWYFVVLVWPVLYWQVYL